MSPLPFSNEDWESKTDPDARIAKLSDKGTGVNSNGVADNIERVQRISMPQRGVIGAHRRHLRQRTPICKIGTAGRRERRGGNFLLRVLRVLLFDAFLHDANYNFTAALADSTHAVVERCRYSPYGEVTFLNPDFSAASSQSASAIGNQHLYTGRERDPESGLQLNRHRYYASHLGRWLTRDPIGYRGGGANLYVYVWGMPTRLIDPLGLWWWDDDWIEQGVGGVIGAQGDDVQEAAGQAIIDNPIAGVGIGAGTGAIAGAGTGAAGGAIIGSVLPGPGTLAGAVLGGSGGFVHGAVAGAIAGAASEPEDAAANGAIAGSIAGLAKGCYDAATAPSPATNPDVPDWPNEGNYPPDHVFSDEPVDGFPDSQDAPSSNGPGSTAPWRDPLNDPSDVLNDDIHPGSTW